MNLPAAAPAAHLLQVAVSTPAHSALGDLLSYACDRPLPPGTLVRVPLGRREVLGVVWDAPAEPPPLPAGMAPRAIAGVLEGMAPLDAAWRRLVAFAARYYQRALGELALAALPPQLRELTPEQLARRMRRTSPAFPPLPQAGEGGGEGCKNGHNAQSPAHPCPLPQGGEGVVGSISLSAEQASAAAQIDTNPGPFLLFGSTGSGKTEVYLHSVQQALAASPAAQALVMVPEINLTPQLEARFRERFAPLYGDAAVVSLHSGMTNPQRLKSWLAAHAGAARIVLGTRMAIFASLPGLRLIVVDEEHDASYKQQEGARYSARDLALWRARDQGAPGIFERGASAYPQLVAAFLDGAQLGQQPWSAGDHLGSVGLLVDSALAAIGGLELEMLHRVGHVQPAAVDPGVPECAVEKAAGRTDERLTATVLHVTGLFADQHDRGCVVAGAEHGLLRMLVQRASVTLAGRSPERRDVEHPREIIGCAGFGHALDYPGSTAPIVPFRRHGWRLLDGLGALLDAVGHAAEALLQGATHDAGDDR